LLTDRYAPDKPPAGQRQWDSRFSRTGLQKIEPVVSQLRQLGEKYGRTPAQIALNWLIAQSGVIPIPGAKTAKQTQENAGALDWKLSPQEILHLEEVSRQSVG
jgi:aryl-alcohol dehydrogenase-like predicted oxidoreductase